MNETLKSINNRIFSNPVYFIFILSSAIVHWRFFATMFLVSNESIVSNYKVTKDVYLKHILFDPNNWIISSIILLIPFIITGLILYLIQPQFLIVLLKKHTEYEVRREMLQIEADRALADERAQRDKKEEMQVKAEAEKTIAQISTKAEIAKIDPTVPWEDEFQKLKSSSAYTHFKYFVQRFYSGDKSVNNPSLASYLDSAGITNMSPNSPNYANSFTDKGKYFVRRVQESE